MPKFISIAVGLLGLSIPLIFNACSKTDQPQSVQTFSNSSFFFSKMTNLSVDVAYETNAAPFDGSNTNGRPLWQLLEDNLKAIFSAHPVTFIVPKTLAEMVAMPAQNKTVWTSGDVVALAAQYQKAATSDTEARFQILFLNGKAADANGGANPNVIGFQVTGTQIIAMFKDVIRASGTNPNGIVPKYVEQSTLIHEMGHALGFVNNGIPMTTSHLDTAHGAHCTNKNCVMYYLNEGASDLASFVQTYITSGSNVMFGQECLSDSQNFK